MSRGRPSAARVIAAIVVIAAVAGPIVLLATSGGFSSGPDAGAKLSVVSLVAHDEGWGTRSPAHLDIAVRNAGADRAVIDEAEIEVLHVYELRRCAPVGAPPAHGTRGASLATDSAPGQTVAEPLHRQLGAGAAQRFSIPLSVEAPTGRRGSVFLFELRVDLHGDGAQADVGAGTALISLPGAPRVGDYYWGPRTAGLVRDLAANSPEALVVLSRSVMPCWRANTATLRQALAAEDTRSPRLAAVAAQLTRPTLGGRE